MKDRIKHIWFDMDGTLIDTDYANFLSYKKAIHSVTNNGLELSYNPKVRFNRSFLKIALPNLNHTDYDKITQTKEEYYIDFLSETKLNNVIAGILFKYSRVLSVLLSLMTMISLEIFLSYCSMV